MKYSYIYKPERKPVLQATRYPSWGEILIQALIIFGLGIIIFWPFLWIGTYCK